jgi:UDP-N-acetylglucosamine transferase subunit ALG13
MIDPASRIDKSEMAAGTLVTVGFMPNCFTRLFDLLMPCIEVLPRPIIIQAGPLREHPFFVLADLVVDFASSAQMQRWTQQAQLVISHAGVGNVKSANQYGKMPILVPRVSALKEHIDNHQIELAEMMTSAGLAVVVSPTAPPGQLMPLIENVLSGTLPAAGVLQVEQPSLFAKGTVLAVSSVGGHRSELEKIALSLGDCTVVYMTDEMCEEVKAGAVTRFPSCNKRRHIGIRFLQALSYLIRHPDIKTVITTGAGVGAVFIAAAKLLGLRTIAIESMTRIKSPGLWFKLAGRISDEAYAYSWSEWLSTFPRVKKIGISVFPRPTHSQQ